MSSQLIEKLSTLIQENIFYSLLILYAVTLGSILLISNMVNEENNLESSEILQEPAVPVEDDTIFIDLSGAVENPGVYELAAESRLSELVSLAGGFSESASEEWLSKYINLSSKLKDSQKIYIPFKWDDPINVNGQSREIATLTNSYTVSNYLPEKDPLPQPSETSDGNPGQSETSTQGTVNVNTASQEDIDGLPGIGPVYAARIIENRPYNDLSDLTERSGVPGSVLEKIQSQIGF